MKQTKNTAFTLVELIVVAAIIAILGTIWFVSFSESLPDARDTQRKSDIAKINSSLKLYKQNKGAYPFPGERFDISVWSSNVVAYQWKLDNTVSLTTLNDIPLDPELGLPYMYSITKNRGEFQVAGTLENQEENIAILKWDYRSVSRNRLPTIAVADRVNIDVNSDTNKFIFDGGKHNLPYDFLGNTEPISDGTSLALLLSDPAIILWEKNDFRTCTNIGLAGKSIWDWEYQILTDSWALTNTGCTF